MDEDETERDKKELALSKIILLVLAAIGIGVVIWLAWIRPSRASSSINSYDACAKAGNEIQESYPPVCVTKDGRRFVQPVR
ncbi:MAG TPA: hypothetical protein VMY99_03755 [Nevskiaceae bacterium]|nr:hypothetical protein [Nevskiaceae bacterium]